jgi:hypothetical protein
VKYAVITVFSIRASRVLVMPIFRPIDFSTAAG